MSEQAFTRKATVIEADLYTQARDCNRWAVIIGVSKYKHSTLDLKYADRDAEKLYQLLLAPQGGHFQKEYICKLTNKDATRRNITRALRSFLKKPAREDLVIIYFACHGSPDPDRPGNVYLLTHDSDPQDIAGTALPMGDIDRALKDTLLSEKVIILADTCHSAAIGGGIRSRAVTESTLLINRYLKEISQARQGTALLTSAEANEVSFEDKRWGGGHGVFTYYLLQGLRGEADLNNNGFVAVGELFEYVRENVKKATNHRQHPSIGTNPFDRNMPLAIAFPNAEENLEESATSGMPISNLLGSVLPTWSADRGRPAFRSRYAAITLATLLLGGGVLFLGMRDVFSDTPKPTDNGSSDSSGSVVDTSEQVLKEAEMLEKEASAQLQQLESDFTEEGLEEVMLTWKKAQTLLQGVNEENMGYEPAIKALKTYESYLQYVRALKLGWLAANRAAFGDENTVEDWDNLNKLRERAITLLETIPVTETAVYDKARDKILEYESDIITSQEFRLQAPYDSAVRKANAAIEAQRVAETSDAWREVAGLWRGAAQQMLKVTTEDKDRWAKAQEKKLQYEGLQLTARNQANELADRELLGE